MSQVNYLTAGGAAGDGNFCTRVSACLSLTALAALAESASLPDHPVRALFANRLLQNATRFIPPIAVAIATQPEAQGAASLAAVTDPQIQTAVSRLFTQWAYSLCLPSS